MRMTVWILFGCLLSGAPMASDDTPGAGRAPERERIRSEQLTFLGYDCRDDCSAHKAGFAWAESSGIADARACTGPDPAFVEGCRAYAECGGSSRDAGYDWAAENEIGDVRACQGAGASFAEGCLEYVF
jgi:hypothetical protein